MQKNHFIWLLVFMSLFFNGNAQSTLNRPLMDDYSGLTLTQAFAMIEQQYGISIFYKDNWIENGNVPKLPANITLANFFEMALSKNKLSYIDIKGTSVILVPSGYNYVADNDKALFIKPVGNPLEKGKFALNKVEGYIKYGKTGDPVVGAVIVNKKHNQQTTSDHNGYYSMNLPGGNSVMDYSFIGLEPNSIEIDVFSNGKLDCELFESSIQIEAVNITAYSGKNNIDRTQMGVVHVDMKSLSKLPVLMGEADIIKGMTLLPGVKTTSELSAGFNVRGGSADQNQIMVEGAPLYSTSHLFGLFSTLMPEAISNVEFHKGTQSANYGGRLASVMDIQLKNPNNDKITGRASFGTYSSGVFVEGPVKKDFCTFSLGGRTTYANWLLKKVPDIDIRQSETNFYDLIGNLNFNFNKKNQLKLFAYYSYDYFKYSNKNVFTYGSAVGGLNYRHNFNEILSMGINSSYTDYKNDLSLINDPVLASTVKTGINQFVNKVEFNLQLHRQKILFGAEGSNYVLTPGNKVKYGDESNIIPKLIDTEKAIELAGFVHDDFSITDNISLLGGLRYSWYSKYGVSQSYVYDANHPVSDNSVTDTLYFASSDFVKPYAGFEPRLGIRYKLSEGSSLKLGFHVTRQYMHLISNSASSTPSDYWKSADLNIKPMMSRQYSLGYFKNFMNNVIETSAEIYYKQTNNPLAYRNGAVLTMNATIERDVIAGYSKAYGLELMVKKNSGLLNGWISYTLSKSLIQVDGAFTEDKINGGKFFPSYNDKLHDLSIAVNYQFTRRWNFAGNFLLSSGLPATFPEKRYTYRNHEVVYFSERNKYRLEAYHRLDVAVTYEGYLKKTKKVHPSFTFSVYNVYGHNNYYSVYYKKDVPSELNQYNKYGLYKLSVIGVPIPSITVNLKF